MAPSASNVRQRDGLRRALAAILLMAAALAAGCQERADASPGSLDALLAADWSGLSHRVVSSMDPGQIGGTLVLFLHGYGSGGDGYAHLARQIATADTRVVLPTAVLPHSSGRGAMWWEFVDPDWPKPYSDDPTANAWPKPSRQLPRAREAVLALLAEARATYAPDRVLVAGHSQGAMLALDVALASERPVDGVALVAGYLLLDTLPRVEAADGPKPPVLVAHGRGDSLVPFDAAERLQRVLEANGFAVRLAPHGGGHGIEAPVVTALRDFVRNGVE